MYADQAMNIVIPDDCRNAVRGLACFARLARPSVTIYDDSAKDLAPAARRIPRELARLKAGR